MNKQQLIAEFGGTEAEMARQLGMSPQRVNLWGDTLNKQQQDGVIAAVVRGSKTRPPCVPVWIWDSIAHA
jgi:hypothetical protein